MRLKNLSQIALLMLFIAFFQVSCNKSENSTTSAETNLIPIPIEMKMGNGSFLLTETAAITLNGDHADLKNIGQYLADFLNPATGFDIQISTEGTGNIVLSLKEDTELGEEGYDLNVSKDKVELSANTPAGLFRGIQTIRQMLPATIEHSDKQDETWTIPTATIRDYPTYGHRGAMLDIARHFFGVEDIKKYIDYIAMYKMNILHLHLTDDQGWRIEIKSWPKLAEYGGKTQVGGGDGGFLTQEEYTEIINYAASKYITVIPEIDMPGHTNAALAAYPELYCDGKKPELYTGIEVGFSTLCIGMDKTYEFIDDVIREVAGLTPGPYIHIGGDESHATKKPDYIEFVQKTEAIVNKYDKIMVGWDEIATSKLNNTSVSQLWHSPANAKLAVEQGMKLILSPANKAYMDMQYDSTSRIGLHWAAYIEVDSGYIWSPETVIEGITQDDILGIEAPLWTETVENLDDIEYLIFPRLLGYSEIGWSSANLRDWNTYKTRLVGQKERFKIMKIDYYPSPKLDWDYMEEVKN